jgi:hypothetical protein
VGASRTIEARVERYEFATTPFICAGDLSTNGLRFFPYGDLPAGLSVVHATTGSDTEKGRFGKRVAR